MAQVRLDGTIVQPSSPSTPANFALNSINYSMPLITEKPLELLALERLGLDGTARFVLGADGHVLTFVTTARGWDTFYERIECDDVIDP